VHVLEARLADASQAVHIGGAVDDDVAWELGEQGSEDG